MTPEVLKTNELPAQAPPQSAGYFAVLTEKQIQEVATERRQQLEELKGAISLKRYYAIEEKINAEEKNLKDILDWQEGKSSRLSKYSFILDPHYFEQEFFN